MFYWQDIRHTLRVLARQPFFTTLTVVVLAGGLALSIFTFSFLHMAMIRPLPLPEGAGLVRLMIAPGASGTMDAADLAAMRSGITTLAELGAWRSHEVITGTAERTRAIEAVQADWNIFEVTRTRPALGRGFRPDDQLPGAPPVVVLSDRTWRAVFGADRGIVGKVAQLSGVGTEVIGVMPRGYGFPLAADAWIPMASTLRSLDTPDQEYLATYARLAPGVEPHQAEAELTALLLRARRARPGTDSLKAEPTGVELASFPMAQIGPGGPLVLTVLNTLAALILLLACINVTNLLLARANERARETAVRLALGAPRGRLVMQTVWESAILCVAGGVLATGLATWGLHAINGWARANLPDNLAFWWVWGFDRTVPLAAGAFVAAAIAVLSGVASRRAVNTQVNAVLQDASAGGGGRRESGFMRALVVIQVATVSVIMFFGALAAIVAHRVTTVDLGYDTRNLLSGTVLLPNARYPDSDSRGRFYQRLLDHLTARPAVDGGMLRAPLAKITEPSGEFELAQRPPGAAHPRTFVLAVLGHLTPLGIGLREGRFFDSRDTEGGAPAAIVSAAFAAREWPGTPPLGRQLRLTGLGESERWRTVVGVVDDVLLGNPLSRDRSPIAVYVPLRQSTAIRASAIFRHRGTVADGQAAFHLTVLSIDRELATGNVQVFSDMLAKTTLITRSVTKLFAACFAFALLLAVSGTCGLMARSISRRTREIGVRRALGATDGRILGMLLREGGRLLSVGAAAALPLTVLTGWGFSRYVPIGVGVSALTAVAVSAVISLVVLAALWAPTRRAVAIEPRDALR